MNNSGNNKTSQTVFSICTVLLLLFIFFRTLEFVYITLFFLSTSSLSNRLMEFYHKSWMTFSRIVGNTLSKINLFILYFVLFYPYAILKKIISKERAFKSKNESSLFEEAEQINFNKDYFEKPW